MKKRMTVKLTIAALFCGIVLCMIFADGVFGMVRAGISTALGYDFEFYEIARAIGIKTDEDSVIVEGESGVEYYERPVDGKIIKEFSHKEPYAEYKCELFYTVKSPCSGTVAAVTQEGFGYGVTVKNGFGTEIRLKNLAAVYVAEGERVTPGQNVGSADNGGVLRVEVYRNGEAQDPEEYF